MLHVGVSWVFLVLVLELVLVWVLVWVLGEVAWCDCLVWMQCVGV